MLSAVVLAAAELLSVPTARAESVFACGCVAEPPCSSPESSDEPQEKTPPSAERAAGRSGEKVDLAWHDLSSPSMDGVALKLSFYRGVGGGLTGSFTREALTLTFEGGAGVGGSFSVGSLLGHPEDGLSFEARASTSGGLRFVRFPDFGLTLSRDGMVQGYVDAKTDHFRTRFRSRTYSLAEGEFEGPSEAPTTRRSWSLGTEFKVAAAYTVRVPLGRFNDVWAWLHGVEHGDRHSRSPPSLPADRLGATAVLGRAAFRRSPVVRPRGRRRRVAARRFGGPRTLRVPRLVRAFRRVRSVRSRGAGSSRTPRRGPRDRGASAAADGEEGPGAA